MKKLMLSFGFFVFSFQLVAQNPSWIVAPNYWNQNLPSPNALPTGPSTNNPTDPFDYYDGVTPHGSSNMITDLNGDIRFFIIDGMIYDETGAFVDHTILGNYLSDFVPSYDNSVTPAINKTRFDGVNSYYEYHGKETVIVPHPTNCSLYYVFGTMHLGVGVDFVTTGNGTPYFSLYDATAKQVVNSGAWYGYSDINNIGCFPEINSTSIFNSLTTANPAQNNGDAQVQDVTWAQDLKFAYGMGLAAVQGSKANETFILSSNSNHFYILKIEANGNLRYWKRYGNLTGANYNQSIDWKNPSEFEVVYDSNLSIFKVARAVKEATAFGEHSDLLTASFSSNFLSVLSVDVTEVSDIGGVGRTINGLEFSPDKNKVLFTTTIESAPFNYNSIHYIDLAANPPTFNDVLNGTNQFQNSFIELGVDANIYFSTPTGLKRMTNPNVPNGLNISNAANITINGCFDQFSVTDPNLRQLRNYPLPDQVDFMDYNAHLLTEACCVLNSGPYDQLSYTATTSATWKANVSGGSNPLTTSTSNTVTIRDELRIPAGQTVTIQDMILKFAPGARLVIENGPVGGQGGKLYLEGTTVLTVDDVNNCGDFWLGVEVWGNSSEPQGNPYNSSQGVLRMFGTLSRIEYAKIGVLCSQRPDINQPNQFLSSRNGGIVISENSPTFLNNQIGIYILRYFNSAYSNGANMSKVVNTTFSWDQNLPSSLLPKTHLKIDRIRELVVKGCHFSQNDPTQYMYYDRGVGIESNMSSFNVDAFCMSNEPVGFPCSNLQPSIFKNLNVGILSNYIVTNLGFTARQAIFNECVTGISTFRSASARIELNDFIVEEAPASSYQTTGLFLNECTGYTVQENKFHELSGFGPGGAITISDLSYGIVVHNSGIANNEIYNNNFYNLHVGGQSQKINGSNYLLPGKVSGLKWTCNKFDKIIEEADLGVNGVVNHYQGVPITTSPALAMSNAARNIFSEALAPPNPIEHDIKVFNPSNPVYPYIQDILYVPLNNDAHIPNDADVNSVFYVIASSGGNYIAPSGNYCSSKIVNKVALSSGLASLKSNIDNLEAILERGGRNELLQRIYDYPNAISTRDSLLNTGSILSDEVLEAYLNNCTVSSYIKEVIVYNSSLSEKTRDDVRDSDLPVSSKVIIENAQANISQRKGISEQLNLLNFDYTTTLNYYLNLLMIDESENYLSTELIDELILLGDIPSKKLLLGIYTSQGDLVNAALLRDELSSLEHPDYITLMEVMEELNGVTSIADEIANNANLLTIVDALIQSESIEVSSSATALLIDWSIPYVLPEFLPLTGPSFMSLFNNQSTESEFKLNTDIISIYPNPSTGKVYFDLPNQDEDVMTIELFDLSGKQITIKEFQKTNGELIDFSDVKKGTYMVRITLGTDYTESQLLQLE